MTTPRMEQLVRAQRNRAPTIVVLTFAFSAYVAYSLFGLTLNGFFTAFVCTYVLCKIVAFFSIMQLQRKIYRGDVEAFVEDIKNYERVKRSKVTDAEDEEEGDVESDEAPEPGPKQISVTIIERPEKAIARFRDFPIFEWLIIDVDGTPHKYLYEGIMNNPDTQFHNLKQDEILFPPGVIYKKSA